MPLSGPVVHQQLTEAYGQMQAELHQLREQTDQAADYREHLLESRNDSLVKLAQYYLPELTTESIRQTWDSVRPDIEKVLLRKQHHCDQLVTQLTGLEEQRSSLDQSLVNVNEQVSNAEETLQELTSRVEQRLREDDDFVRLSDRAAIAEAALERAEANLQEIDQESARKLPAFDESSLFRYLYDQGFGTPEYKKKGLTRRMDRWVAKLVGFQKAKQSYEFLKQTPQHMRTIIAQDRESFDLVMNDLERQRDEVANRLGLPKQIDHVEQFSAKRKELLTEIDENLASVTQRERQLTELDDPRGPFYQEAIELFRGMLSQMDTAHLERQAHQTIEISDDQIVANLIGIDDKLDSFDAQSDTHSQKIADLQKFLEEFGRLMQRFRGASFDTARSQFVGTLDIYTELRRGRAAGDIQMVWDSIRRNQRWGPSTMDKVGQMAAHPMTQVLVSAMAQAAGSALGSYAERAGQRRQRQRSTRPGSWSHRR